MQSDKKKLKRSKRLRVIASTSDHGKLPLSDLTEKREDDAIEGLNKLSISSIPFVEDVIPKVKIWSDHSPARESDLLASDEEPVLDTCITQAEEDDLLFGSLEARRGDDPTEKPRDKCPEGELEKASVPSTSHNLRSRKGASNSGKKGKFKPTESATESASSSVVSGKRGGKDAKKVPKESKAVQASRTKRINSEPSTSKERLEAEANLAEFPHKLDSMDTETGEEMGVPTPEKRRRVVEPKVDPYLRHVGKPPPEVATVVKITRLGTNNPKLRQRQAAAIIRSINEHVDSAACNTAKIPPRFLQEPQVLGGEVFITCRDAYSSAFVHKLCEDDLVMSTMQLVARIVPRIPKGNMIKVRFPSLPADAYVGSVLEKLHAFNREVNVHSWKMQFFGREKSGSHMLCAFVPDASYNRIVGKCKRKLFFGTTVVRVIEARPRKN